MEILDTFFGSSIAICGGGVDIVKFKKYKSVRGEGLFEEGLLFLSFLSLFSLDFAKNTKSGGGLKYSP